MQAARRREEGHGRVRRGGGHGHDRRGRGHERVRRGGERVKKGELFFVHMIFFYWPAALTTTLAPWCKEGVAAVQAVRRREEGPRGRIAAAARASEKRSVIFCSHNITLYARLDRT